MLHGELYLERRRLARSYQRRKGIALPHADTRHRRQSFPLRLPDGNHTDEWIVSYLRNSTETRVRLALGDRCIILIALACAIFVKRRTLRVVCTLISALL